MKCHSDPEIVLQSIISRHGKTGPIKNRCRFIFRSKIRLHWDEIEYKFYILGMAKMEGQVKILLNIDKVLSAEEIEGLGSVS